MLAKLDPQIINFGRMRQLFANIGQLWPFLVRLDQRLPTRVPGATLNSWSNCSTTVGQLFGNFRAASKLAGFVAGNFPGHVAINVPAGFG